MRPTLIALAVALHLVGAVPSVAAQSSAATARVRGSASVEGDVYLRMQSGDVRKMAASRTHLVPWTATASFRPLCAAWDSARSVHLRALRTRRVARDSAHSVRKARRDAWRLALDSATVAVERSVFGGRRAAGALVDALAAQPAASTGMAAHYAFPAIAPGAYALYSDTDLPYFWLVPIRVGPGAQTQDLDNTNVTRVVRDKAAGIADAACAFAMKLPGARETRPSAAAVETRPRLLNTGEVQAALARRRRWGSGTVEVSMRVLEDGTVDPVSLEAFAEAGGEAAAAEDAAAIVGEMMRFAPATLDGVPVRVIVQIPITFR
jgi:hypothetical protein